MEEENIDKKTKKEKIRTPEKVNHIIFNCLTVIWIIAIAIAIVPKALQNDTFYNIKCGEYIFKHGIFGIGQDPFSWHKLPYTWPHWLFDLASYFLYAISGKYWGYAFYAMTVVFTSILGISLYLTSLKLSKNNRVVSAVITLFAVYLLKQYIAARAQLITFTLFVLEIFFIEKLLETNKKRYGACLLLIAFLIVQLHCAVFPMFFVFAAPYVAEYVFILISDLCLDEILFRNLIKMFGRLTNSQKRKEKYNKIIEKSKKNTESRKIKAQKRRKNPYKVIIQKNPAMKTLIIFLIIALLLGFINPFGLGAFTYTYKIYKGNTTLSINEHLPLTLAENKGFAIMLVVIFALLILFDIKVRLSDLLMFAGTVFLAFKARRQVSLVVIMCMPILAKLISGFFEKYDNDFCNIVEGFTTSILGMAATTLIIFLISQDLYKDKLGQSYVESNSYPIYAAEWLLNYMDENNISKEDLKLYNEYNYGSYLLLQGIPVFIDSRCDLYTPEFNGDRDIFSDALAVPGLSYDYISIFEKYGVNYAIFYAGDNVIAYISKDENYTQIYNDGQFAIYQRLVKE